MRHEFSRRGLVRGAGALGAGLVGSWALGCRPDEDPPVAPAGGGAAPTGEEAEPDARWASLEGFCEGVPEVTTEERAAKLARLSEAVGELGLSAVVLEAGLNLEHFTGVRWWPSERPMLFVARADGKHAFVGPAFEEGRLREGAGENAAVRVWQEHESPYAPVADLVPKGKLGIDPAMRAFVAGGLRGALGDERVHDGAPAIDAVRMIKTEVELARIRRACEATKAALGLVAQHVVPGMPESEVKALARAAQSRAGLSDIWVLALAGPNAAFPHGTHKERVLEAGDLMLIDTGGALHGYQSDITRTWAVGGEPPEEVRRAWEVVAEAQEAGLATVRPGAKCGDVDAAARAVVAKSGFGEDYSVFTHRLGHGIGRQVHERPYLRKDNETVLQPGMTMSDEPGIYVPGKFGVRIEDILAVTEDGAEVFGPRQTSIGAPT